MTILIQMIGAVALLVWGTHSIRVGMFRTFGDQLRRWLAKNLSSRISAFLAGMGLSMMLQSSTASALVVSSFQKKGLVTTAIALCSVLGADLGSALMVRVLSLNIALLIPILLFTGVLLYLKKERTAMGQFGMILLGLAFVMMALNMISTTTAPLKQMPELLGIFEQLTNWPLMAIGVGMVMALVCFSSLAVVMITAGTVAAGVVGPTPALWIVLGANLGSAFLAVITTSGSSPMARRAPTGNCLFRIGAFLFGSLWLAFCPWPITGLMDTADGVIYFHILFNGIAGVLGLFFVKPMTVLVDKWLPSKSILEEDEGAIRLLSKESLMSGQTALEASRQEVIHNVELLSRFWHDLNELLIRNPEYGEIQLMRERKKRLYGRTQAITRYMTELLKMALSENEAQLWQTLRNANGTVELATRVADNAFKQLARKKCANNRFFSHEGEHELTVLHTRIAHNLDILTHYLQADNSTEQEQARKWLRNEKSLLVATDFSLVERHVQRIARGESESVETSTLHVDLLTNFRRFNHLICSIATFASNIPEPHSDLDHEDGLLS